MKNLVVIIPASAQQECADRLRNLSMLDGFTFTPVEGHGRQTDRDPLLSPRDRVVGYVPRVRIDIVLENTAVNNVIDTLRGNVGRQGVYWVTDVDDYGRLD